MRSAVIGHLALALLVASTVASAALDSWRVLAVSDDDDDLYGVWPFDSPHAIVVGEDGFAAVTTNGGARGRRLIPMSAMTFGRCISLIGFGVGSAAASRREGSPYGLAPTACR
jgi:hypothetical protein